MKQQLSEYGINLGIVPIECDNTSAVNFTKNLTLHSLMKHIKIMNHFNKDRVTKEDCVIEFVSSSNQMEDIFMKHDPK